LIGAGLNRPNFTNKRLLGEVLKTTGKKIQGIDDLDNMKFFHSLGTQTFKDRGYHICHILSYNNLSFVSKHKGQDFNIR